jgi:NitT/TauT family transport system substrate-binding protein
MRRPLVALVAVALLGVVAGCGSDGDEAPAASGGTKQVKVGVIPILDVAPIYLGKEKGFFSNRGIELTMETGQGGAAIVPGVVSGQFQFGFSNVTSLLIAQTRGLPLKVVSNGVASTSKDKAGTTRSRQRPTWPADGSRSTP